MSSTVTNIITPVTLKKCEVGGVAHILYVDSFHFIMLHCVVLCRCGTFYSNWRFVAALCGQMMVSILFFSNNVFLNFLKINLCISFWLSLVIFAVDSLSLFADTRGYSLVVLSLEVVVHGFCCPAACEIFLDQGSKQCPLYWQTDPQPLNHHGSLIMLCFVLN